MVEMRSRLQLLEDLRKLEREHNAAVPGSAEAEPTFDRLLDRYSFGQLQVIADFLSADTERLHGCR
jgi:hypothetical protein